MRSPYQLSALLLVLTIVLIAPLALPAGELSRADASCPAPAASATDLAALLQAPPALPATVFTYGVCASSCNPATCNKGPHGFCQQQSCILGQRPSTCAAGDSCIPIPDCN